MDICRLRLVEDNSLVPWESWVYVTVGGGMEITFTDEMGSGHFNFAPIPLRQPIGMRSITRIQENAPETVYMQAVGDDARAIPTVVADASVGILF